MTDRPRTIAYVLPVFDEADTVAAFHDALVAATDGRPDLDYEFVYVDDGSRDGSLERLLELREKDEERLTSRQIHPIDCAMNRHHCFSVGCGFRKF